MTNAVVSGVVTTTGKHGVGGPTITNGFTSSNGSSEAAAVSHKLENGYLGGGGGAGDQLETNSLARIRSSDSFRYVPRIVNNCAIGNGFMNHNR